ncbi:hypothetical protein H0H81_002869 [Sphagnurus paluster]|uniref:Uncharacterized protein n=1 Tax=Sphagnurus paluster TaxID=117069 RepID=A0A9P7GMW4_9AGAR|nr:hypothetical protein H0H81_002869 [Sphagnurus paluster]
MLGRAMSMASTVPFTWGFIDKPAEGQVLLLFIPPHAPFPIDGLRFQDQEVKYTIPAGPNRVRPSFAEIIPALMNQPVRNYPLRVVNEPAIYVAGEKMGHKVYPPGAAPTGPSGVPPVPQPGMPMGFAQQHAMVAQQNNNMEMLDRRREQERARNRSGSTGARPRPEDDDSGDEIDQISTRTLALNRYKRNHDMMNEVFKFAAYGTSSILWSTIPILTQEFPILGDRNAPPPPRPYSIFNKSEIEEKTVKLQEEIEALKAKSAERQAAWSIRERENRMELGADGVAA